ncbi:acetylornithine deacetylase [Parvularcula lutaonensis]|uniref:Acetylornithine deacetylase n=1 Tax=Parvularcula lutaonensis TaxID=491923 RepID=A0ABV7M7L1_9PROT|nr:acetylornithine deacetylase [Parvularcula lutaonensis]GGY56635.1 acetylornithine deacetylase [Parvularcula lutaonensis]
MTAPLEDILAHLEPLVEADSQNPPRHISADGALVAAVRRGLPGFVVNVRDLGDGCLIIEARRGETGTLFNVHLDTVPVAPGWSHDPHVLTRAEDRAFGLGVCDTKGAAGVLFALAQHTDEPMHLLLTTDEEAGKSRCIRTYLEDSTEARLAVVAEPTDCLARTEHRGIFSGVARFEGESAHASDTGRRSAVHDAARMIAAALDLPGAAESRLNFGRIEGGVKANMVAAEAEVQFGFRNRPGTEHRDLLRQISGLAGGARFEERFVGPALPHDRDGASGRAQAEAQALASRLGLPLGAPVDFWTEASLFAEAGIPAIVLGAGSIRQAHNADEFVTYGQLAKLYDLYAEVVTGDA